MYDPKLRKEAKHIAKVRFAERFVQPMAAVLIYALPVIAAALLLESFALTTSLPAMLPPAGLYVLVQIFVAGPLFLGLMRYCIDRLHGGPMGVMDLFTSFGDGKQYLRGVKAYLCVIVRAIPWMIPPLAILFGYTFVRLWRDPAIMESAEAVSQLAGEISLLSLVVMIPFAARVLRYLAAYILMVRDPSLGAWKATGQAARLFKGRWFELTVFFASFVGWQVFGMYTLGIGMLFYAAYLLMAFVWYAERVMDGVYDPPLTPDAEHQPPL